MEPRVVFEDQNTVARMRSVSRHSKITAFIIDKSGGLIKNSTQANILMWAFIVVAIFVCYALLADNKTDFEDYQPPEGYKIVTPTNAPPRIERE
jgi:hypothetical protein